MEISQSKVIRTLALTLALFILLISRGYADSENTNRGVLDFNIYPYLSDVSSDTVFTINIAATLSNNLSYFSLTNFYNESDVSELNDTTSFYSEQNIRWKIGESPFDLTGQFNFRSGVNNDRHRLGFRWRLNNSDWLKSYFARIYLSWSINFHLLQFDHTDSRDWQIEHVFRLGFPYISNRIYLAGFIDQTFNEDLPDDYPSNPVVVEAQLGWRLVENFFLVTEYRINQYRRGNVNNLAFGLQYKIVW